MKLQKTLLIVAIVASMGQLNAMNPDKFQGELRATALSAINSGYQEAVVWIYPQLNDANRNLVDKLVTNAVTANKLPQDIKGRLQASVVSDSAAIADKTAAVVTSKLKPIVDAVADKGSQETQTLLGKIKGALK